jgi:hypothetical protein
MVQNRNAYKDFVRKVERKKALGRRSHCLLNP